MYVRMYLFKTLLASEPVFSWAKIWGPSCQRLGKQEHESKEMSGGGGLVQNIRATMAMADEQIQNDGSINELHLKVEQIVDCWLPGDKYENWISERGVDFQNTLQKRKKKLEPGELTNVIRKWKAVVHSIRHVL